MSKCKLAVTRIYTPVDEDKPWSLYEGFDIVTGRTVTAVGSRFDPEEDPLKIPDLTANPQHLPIYDYRFAKKGEQYRAYIIDR